MLYDEWLSWSGRSAGCCGAKLDNDKPGIPAPAQGWLPTLVSSTLGLSTLRMPTPRTRGLVVAIALRSLRTPLIFAGCVCVRAVRSCATRKLPCAQEHQTSASFTTGERMALRCGARAWQAGELGRHTPGLLEPPMSQSLSEPAHVPQELRTRDKRTSGCQRMHVHARGGSCERRKQAGRRAGTLGVGDAI